MLEDPYDMSPEEVAEELHLPSDLSSLSLPVQRQLLEFKRSHNQVRPFAHPLYPLYILSLLSP